MYLYWISIFIDQFRIALRSYFPLALAILSNAYSVIDFDSHFVPSYPYLAVFVCLFCVTMYVLVCSIHIYVYMYIQTYMYDTL